MAHLSLVSYNLHGFNQGLPMFREMTNHFDVICVQEHWLSTPQFDRLDSLSSDFVNFNKSAMDHIYVQLMCYMAVPSVVLLSWCIVGLLVV